MSREPWCILKDPYGSLWIHQEGHQEDHQAVTQGPTKGVHHGSTKGTTDVGTVEDRVREGVAGAEVGEGVPRRCSPGKCHPGGNL